MSNEKYPCAQVIGRILGSAFLIKVIDYLNTSGETTAMNLVNQRDSSVIWFKISHFCHVKSDELCVENTLFELEPKSVNDRRRSHQKTSLKAFLRSSSPAGLNADETKSPLKKD